MRTSLPSSAMAFLRRRMWFPNVRCNNFLNKRHDARGKCQLFAGIAESPLIHIDGIGEARDHRTAANLGIADNIDFLSRFLVQLLTHPLRHMRAVSRIHEVEQMNLGEE